MKGLRFETLLTDVVVIQNFFHQSLPPTAVLGGDNTSNHHGGNHFNIAEAPPITIDPPDSLVLQNFTATVGNLSTGYHKLYLQTKNNNGNWSLTGRRNIEVINAATYLVAGAEYYFNNDPGVGLAQKIHFPYPHPDSSFSFKIPIGQVPAGVHTLYIRAYDSTNKNWSLTQLETDSVVTSVQAGAWSSLAPGATIKCLIVIPWYFYTIT